MKYPYKLLNKKENSIKVEMKLTNDLDFFDGHFEGQAIMPAVAQLYIVEMVAKETFGIKGKFSALRQVKFVGPICPDTTVIISISYDSQKKQINFNIAKKEIIKSKGKLNYHHGQ